MQHSRVWPWVAVLVAFGSASSALHFEMARFASLKMFGLFRVFSFGAFRVPAGFRHGYYEETHIMGFL